MNGGMTNCSFHNRAAVAARAVASSLALLSAAAFGGSCPKELRNPPPACESPVRTCGCPVSNAVQNACLKMQADVVAHLSARKNEPESVRRLFHKKEVRYAAD